MRRKKLAALMVALVGGAATLGTAPTAAHEYSSPTTTTIRYRETTGRFRGTIASNRPKCEVNRKVKLVKQTDSGSRVVGRTRSDDDGRWRIEKPNAAGVYRATVVRRLNRAPGHIHDCQRGASGTITVDP